MMEEPRGQAPGAVASMVCGIVSLCVCGIPFAGLVLGIIAIVLGLKAKKMYTEQPRAYSPPGMATAGFVCGIIGVVLSVIFLCYWIFAVWFVTEHMDEFRRMPRTRSLGMLMTYLRF